MTLDKKCRLARVAALPKRQKRFFQGRSGNKREILNDIFQWNVVTWSLALKMWETILLKNEIKSGRVLEIGARDGGLSLYFALKGFHVVCSDIKGTMESARVLHKKYNVSRAMTYMQIDATKIPYSDNSFDVVVFKSVLGGIGYASGKTSQVAALHELYRVLRPGGVILFAENLIGSYLHQFLRKHFIKNRGPDNTWKYPTYSEMIELFSEFRNTQYTTLGVTTAFGRTEPQRELLHYVDILFTKLLPSTCKTVIVGYGEK